MEKSISIKGSEITFSIWDLGGPLRSLALGAQVAYRRYSPGQKEFVNMLPLVCNDAVALFFMFDLSRKATLCAQQRLS